MKRSIQWVILAFSGLALVFAVVSAAFNVRLALGAAAVAGAFAVWAAMMSTLGRNARGAVSKLGVEAEMRAGFETPVTPQDAVADSEVVAAETPKTLEVDSSAADDVTESEPIHVPGLDLTVPVSVDPCAVLGALLKNSSIAGSSVSAHLWLEDVGTPTLRLVCAQGNAHLDPTPLPANQGLLGEVLDSETARFERLGDAAHEDPGTPSWRWAFPLITEEASGVVAVDFIGDAPPDQAVMESVFASMRGVLTGSLALHVARSEASSARQLLETAGNLSRLIDPDAVVIAALEHALKLSGAETGSVMLLDPDGSKMSIASACGLPDEVVGATRVSEGEGIAGWVLASGRPLVVEDLDHKGPQSRRHGVLSAASVPISDDDGVLGVLNVGSRRFHARFSRSHVRALEAIGRITATSLRNARAVTVTQDLFFDTLKALALAMETRDPYTRGGTARVLEITSRLGAAMGLDEGDAHSLRLAALLHDIGMSAAGDGVAVTNRPLTTVEWGMLKMHPQIAAEILGQAPALQAVIPIVFHHHEHFDGSGYAQGLIGEEIPMGARILSVADAFVAMTSTRPYRAAMSAEQAMEELTGNAGTQFDPAVVEALVQLTSSEAGSFAMRS